MSEGWSEAATRARLARALAESGMHCTPAQLFRAIEAIYPEHLAMLAWLDRNHPEPSVH